MIPPIAIRRLSIRTLRNLRSVDFAPAPHLNVIAGDNGQGKTSLLEAIYVVATTRSFRTERLGEVVTTGEEFASVTARIEEGEGQHEQRAAIGGRSRAYTIDGRKPERLARYATLTPVVVFHPGDLALVSGPAALRRTLLDRVALFCEPTSVEARQRYLHAMRERQRVLETRGCAAPELDAYEDLMAREGSLFAAARERAVTRLATALSPAFASMAARDLALGVVFRPGGCADPQAFRHQLSARRAADLRRRAATFGPQRDDLELSVDGRPARTQASQGQQRVLTLALKVAELATVSAARRARPILLLDDVSSELDPTRTGAVYDFVRDAPGQVFVTTTRPDLLATPALAAADRADWCLRDGQLVA